MKCLCGEPVSSPYLRVAWGERGGDASYQEIFICAPSCLSAHEIIVENLIADR